MDLRWKTFGSFGSGGLKAYMKNSGGKSGNAQYRPDSRGGDGPTIAPSPMFQQQPRLSAGQEGGPPPPPPQRPIAGQMGPPLLQQGSQAGDRQPQARQMGPSPPPPQRPQAGQMVSSPPQWGQAHSTRAPSASALDQHQSVSAAVDVDD